MPSSLRRLTSIDGATTIILTLLADFYAHCARYEELWTALESWQMNIGTLTNAELRR